jgi:hypothetical protein
MIVPALLLDRRPRGARPSSFTNAAAGWADHGGTSHGEAHIPVKCPPVDCRCWTWRKWVLSELQLVCGDAPQKSDSHTLTAILHASSRNEAHASKPG